MPHQRSHSPKAFVRFLLLLATLAVTHAADQPQWGDAWNRNQTSTETGLPSDFDVSHGRNIRWTARLGTESYSTPVIAAGRVYIGTNNEEPRDPRHQGDRGVLLCLDENDGRLLWQYVVPKREEDPYYDWPKTGISSCPTVENGRVYLVNNRGEVVCLDARGLSNGNDGPFLEEGQAMTPAGTNAPPSPLLAGPLDADILWRFDLTREAGIWSHDAAHSSILIHGNHLYINTGTGVDNTHRKIRTPDAPGLVVLDKRTGRYLARDREQMAPRIFHCTWSSPALAHASGSDVVVFAGGNGIIYGFAPLLDDPAPGPPAALRKLWQIEFDPSAPRDEPHRYTSNRREGPSNIYGMPVFVEGRIYVAGGGDWFWGKNEAWLKCYDTTGTPSTTPRLLWSYTLGRHTMSTTAVHDGLAFTTDSQRFLHCVDTATGQGLWTHELKGEIWASPLVADGKVHLGSRRGDFCILAASRDKKLLATLDLGAPISATAVAANRTLYIGTATRLIAARIP